LADNLWAVTGSLPGMSLKRNMLAVRLADGGLALHNPIALEQEAMGRLEAWGTPSLLIAPNKWHRLDAKVFKDRYPKARVIAPRGSRKAVEEVVPVDLTYDEYESEDPTLSFEPLAGLEDVEGALLVRSPDGLTVVLNDVVFNMDRKKDLLGFLFTTVLGSAPGPRVSRLSKLLLVKDRKALRADLERLATLEGLVRLCVAHEKVAHGAEAREALLQAATYL
jgi:hypothetical protein